MPRRGRFVPSEKRTRKRTRTRTRWEKEKEKEKERKKKTGNWNSARDRRDGGGGEVSALVDQFNRLHRGITEFSGDACNVALAGPRTLLPVRPEVKFANVGGIQV